MSAELDQKAVTLLRRRASAGFDLAYQTHAARLHAFLHRLSGRRDVADDLLQHTFMKLAERGADLRPDSDLKAWLFAVARNAYTSLLRAAPTTTDSDAVQGLASVSADVEARLLLGDVEGALSRLRVEDRELLLLVGAEGLEPVTVAGMLGLEAATLRQRLARARARLLDELEREPQREIRNEQRRLE